MPSSLGSIWTHGEFMSLLEFQSPYWEHLDLSNEQMNLVSLWSTSSRGLSTLFLRPGIICLWNTSSHDLTTLFLGLSIVRISSLMGQPRAGDFLFLALFSWKSKLVNCCMGLSSLLLCHGTSCNNKIILRVTFGLPWIFESNAAFFKCCIRTNSNGSK